MRHFIVAANDGYIRSVFPNRCCRCLQQPASESDRLSASEKGLVARLENAVPYCAACNRRKQFISITLWLIALAVGVAGFAIVMTLFTQSPLQFTDIELIDKGIAIVILAISMTPAVILYIILNRLLKPRHVELMLVPVGADAYEAVLVFHNDEYAQKFLEVNELNAVGAKQSSRALGTSR